MISEFVAVAAETPVFNSTAQIYQIIFQFLILVVNFFMMLGIFYVVIGNGALDRMHERREEKKLARQVLKKKN